MTKRIGIIFLLLLLVTTGCKGSISGSKASDTAMDEQTVNKEEKTGEPLLIWSYTDEIETEIEAFEEAYNANVTLEIVDLNGLVPLAVGTVQSGIGVPDVLILDDKSLKDPKMEEILLELTDVIEAHEDQPLTPYLTKSPEFENEIYGLGYQVYPMALFYRSDLAMEALGVQEPEAIQTMFSSYEQLLETGKKLNTAGIKILPDVYSLRYIHDGDMAWLDESGELKAGVNWQIGFETAKQLELNNYVANATQWTDQWLAGMHDGIGLEEASSKVQTQVFSYILPSWALSHVLMLASDSDEPVLESDDGNYVVYNQTSGKWKIAPLTNGSYWGGTYLTINKSSEHLDLGKQFIEYMIYDDAHVKEWSDNSDRIPSNTKIQGSVAFPLGDTFLGGQNYQQTMADLANAIKVDYYSDQALNQKNAKAHEIYEDVLNKFIKGDYHTVDEAVMDFKKSYGEYLSQSLE